MSGIERFVKEQKQDFDIVLSEIKSGRKRSHCMWYIFPQLKGLGMTSTADYYGIDGMGEAREYLSDEYLANNLIKPWKTQGTLGSGTNPGVRYH